MSNRLAVALGLLAGVVTAVLLGVAVLALAPEVPLLPSSSPDLAASPAAGSPAGASPASEPPSSSGPGAASAPPTTAGSASASGTPGSGESPDASVGAFHVGEAAPPLDVVQVGGGRIDLASLRGRPVWIEFMASWCPSCQDEFPLMNRFATRYADTGLVVIGIDVREDEGTAAAFANSLGATFPIGLDEDGSVSRRWGAVALPTHFFIDARGIVRDGAVGGIGPDIMAQGLSTILPGVTVEP